VASGGGDGGVGGGDGVQALNDMFAGFDFLHDGGDGGANVRVFVRIRPLSATEGDAA